MTILMDSHPTPTPERSSSNTGQPPTSGKPLEDFLDTHPHVQFIRYQWVDLSGILRARCLHKNHCLELARKGRPLRCGPITLQALADSSVMPDLPRSGVHELHPDWSSLRILGSGSGAAAYATAMCSIIEKLPQEGNRPNPSACPRQALTNVLTLAVENWGIRFLAGFEVEFVILQDKGTGDDDDDDNNIVPLASAPGHYSVAGMRDPSFRYLEACVTELIGAGVAIQDFHVEGTSGQFEIALPPGPPIQAIDELVRVHDMIKTTVSRHGYIATMAPKPPGARQGSGEHIHLSLELTDHEQSFLAGLLRYLPGICAVTMPYPQSYERVGKLEAGERANWGTENRDVAVRKIEPGHWEIRCADGTANMYLAVATLLAAGLEGIQHQRPLSFPDASSIAENTAANSVGLPPELPRTLGGALQLLEASTSDLAEFLRSEILNRYVTVKRVELARLNRLDQGQLDRLMVTLF